VKPGGLGVAYLQLAASMALVGANVAVAKLLAEALPIPMIAFLRCVLAVLLLWPLARLLEPVARPSGDVLRNLAWQALFGTVIYNAGLLAGLRLTSALEGGLVLASLPAVVALGSAFWLRDRLARPQWIAVLLAAFGMAAMTFARSAGDAAGSMLGNALIFGGVVGEALYVLLARRISGRVGVITASLWMQIFSALMLAPFALPDIGSIAALADPGLAGLLVFHSVTASVLCLLLWYAGLQRVGAGIAGIFTAFLPATAALVAVVILREAFTASHAIGFALMMLSVLIATWPRRGSA
jgi:drug/metabolite transporter (DMT)-like permease